MTTLCDGMLLAAGEAYTYEEVQSLPAMTGSSSPAGHVALASSTYPGGYVAYNAFNQIASGNDTTAWIANGETGWVQRRTPSGIVVWKYRINAASGGASAPRDWILQGSNDGITFVDLHTVTGQTGWLSNVTREFIIPSPQIFSYHRLSISANNGSALVVVGELELLQRIG